MKLLKTDAAKLYEISKQLLDSNTSLIRRRLETHELDTDKPVCDMEKMHEAVSPEAQSLVAIAEKLDDSQLAILSRFTEYLNGLISGELEDRAFKKEKASILNLVKDPKTEFNHDISDLERLNNERVDIGFDIQSEQDSYGGMLRLKDLGNNKLSFLDFEGPASLGGVGMTLFDFSADEKKAIKEFFQEKVSSIKNISSSALEDDKKLLLDLVNNPAAKLMVPGQNEWRVSKDGNVTIDTAYISGGGADHYHPSLVFKNQDDGTKTLEFLSLASDNSDVDLDKFNLDEQTQIKIFFEQKINNKDYTDISDK